VRKLRGLVERLLYVTCDLCEQRLRRCWIGVGEFTHELQVDRECNQLLLHSFVQVTLDVTAVGSGGYEQPLPRRL
jgi:hypothetical protein